MHASGHFDRLGPAPIGEARKPDANVAVAFLGAAEPGGDKAAVVETITNSRAGMMPAWTGRLDPATIKELAIYVHSLGGGQ